MPAQLARGHDLDGERVRYTVRQTIQTRMLLSACEACGRRVKKCGIAVDRARSVTKASLELSGGGPAAPLASRHAALQRIPDMCTFCVRLECIRNAFLFVSGFATSV